MDFERSIEAEFLKRLSQYPVITITGPRQSGKTTLVKRLCKNYAYINLEKPDVREWAQRDPNALLSKYPDGLIIDEVQHVPALLSYIQVIVDEKQKDGMYVLTGSHQLALHEALAQSLAGRTSILQLLPLSLNELKKAGMELSTNEIILNGFYPRIYSKNLNPSALYRDYVKTYLERDVRRMINIKDLMMFQKFMKLCAGRTGTILNMNSLANDIGVSNHTVKHWLSILQASYLIEFVAPYFENFGKRLIKSPKLYFTDVGLASYLLGIETIAQVERDPLRGQLYETMVVMELMKTRFNKGLEANLYFYRDSEKKEIDVIYKYGARLAPIEIKSAQTVSSNFMKGTHYFRELVGDRCGQSYLIYSGNDEIKLEHTHIINYKNAASVIDECDKDT